MAHLAYDAAVNLKYRTNHALVDTFNVNPTINCVGCCRPFSERTFGEIGIVKKLVDCPKYYLGSVL
jgi:hypothetical protein